MINEELLQRFSQMSPAEQQEFIMNLRRSRETSSVMTGEIADKPERKARGGGKKKRAEPTLTDMISRLTPEQLALLLGKQ